MKNVTLFTHWGKA